MKCILSIAAVAVVFFFTAAPGSSQFSPNPMPPGARGGGVLSDNKVPTDTLKPNPGALKQEADELAALASEMPSQIGAVNKGELPKDLTVKLKRIEKIAKHLRSQIGP
jgi:hypothetical protein